jgi:sugar/nucleoside kinase (ribokinase family)
MKKGICCAGNMIVDITYPIETWPNQNELTHITEGIQNSTGGSVCNTMIDLARLDPEMRLVASGFAGYDAEGEFIMEEMGKYPNIDLSMIKREGRTSFTAVMSNNKTKERTFFQHAGANAYYCEEHIDLDHLNVDIFHIGYILLLPALDAEDEEYGTKMARLLHHVQEKGMKTSIDVVSESGDRFARLVTPALKYTDYCVINELEAQQTTGILLRDRHGTLHTENMPAALRKLYHITAGVAKQKELPNKRQFFYTSICFLLCGDGQDIFRLLEASAEIAEGKLNRFFRIVDAFIHAVKIGAAVLDIDAAALEKFFYSDKLIACSFQVGNSTENTGAGGVVNVVAEDDTAVKNVVHDR